MRAKSSKQRCPALCLIIDDVTQSQIVFFVIAQRRIA